MRDSNRRIFLKNSSAAAVAAASFPSGVHAQGNDELKVALIGCGGRGTGAANQALRADDRTKLWAMADIDEGSLDRSRETLEKAGRKVEVDPERRLIGLDAFKKVMAMDEIDVVILTTPPGFRPAHFAAAVEAGKHVFMEKPVAVDAHGVRQVLEAARAAKAKNLKVGVGLNRRHSPIHQDCIKRIHDGVIGELPLIRLYNVRGGVNKRQVRQTGMSELEWQVRNWYYFAWLSGDFPVEQSVHEYDVVRWIKGDENPISCQGQGGRLNRTGPENGNIWDHFTMEYEFADGSLVIAQHRHLRGCWTFFGEKISGTKGSAELAFKQRAQIQLKGEERPSWRAQEEEDSYQIEHDQLFKAIRDDLPHNEAERGANSTLMAIMGRNAGYSGQLITWEEALNSDENLVPNIDSWDDEPPVQPDSKGAYAYPLPPT
ncbi:MAG: myo-inositol 2-dehydrogenase/D-chiro-inositol 1-dehydrogenase [Verrucomicrobiales bacterium]|jgi:myo-inositol 2-dehydrogenase/D-chiro-inositol 1-dehydrogenase